METRALLAILILCGSTYGTAIYENLIDTANKMETESINDILHTTTMYKKTCREEAILAQLKDTLRSQLRTKNSQLLASTLCAAGSGGNQEKVKYHVNLIFENYDKQLVDGIIHETIVGLHGCLTNSQLVDLLWTIHEEGDVRSFELMLKSQLELFHTTANGQHLDNMNFDMKFAFTLYKIKQAKLYSSVKVTLKHQVDRAIRLLPTNVQYLLFYPYFCLMSSKYSEYIYTAMGEKSIQSTSRYIWGWYDKLSIDDTGHVTANTFEMNDDNSTEFLVQLKGIKYDVFYYMMPEGNRIAGWELTSEPMNYIWNVEFLDSDRVVFYQDDYIMCTTDEMTDSQRRLVRGYKRGKYTSESGECQWLLGTCNRKNM